MNCVKFKMSACTSCRADVPPTGSFLSKCQNRAYRSPRVVSKSDTVETQVGMPYVALRCGPADIIWGHEFIANQFGTHIFFLCWLLCLQNHWVSSHDIPVEEKGDYKHSTRNCTTKKTRETSTDYPTALRLLRKEAQKQMEGPTWTSKKTQTNTQQTTQHSSSSSFPPSF